MQAMNNTDQAPYYQNAAPHPQNAGYYIQNPGVEQRKINILINFYN